MGISDFTPERRKSYLTAILEGVAESSPRVRPQVDLCLKALDPGRVHAQLANLIKRVAAADCKRTQFVLEIGKDDLRRAVCLGYRRLSEPERGRIESGFDRIRGTSSSADAADAVRQALDVLSDAAGVRHSILTFVYKLFHEDRALEPGTVLDERFEVVELVGMGAMGVVYRAHDKLGGRKDAALKLLKKGMIRDQAFVHRFQKEAQLLASLHHPNIVRSLQSGMYSEVPYIAMEWVEGETLRARLDAGGRMDWQEAAPIAIGLLQGLQHAHDLGVLHLDISPQNILLSRAGMVKICDFGLARLLSRDQSMTLLSAGGTIGYAAPEVLRGMTPDVRADVYSAAAVFYEMLAGHQAGYGSPDLHEAFNVPQGCASAIRQGLAQSTLERTRSASDFQLALDMSRQEMLADASPENETDAGAALRAVKLFIQHDQWLNALDAVRSLVLRFPGTPEARRVRANYPTIRRHAQRATGRTFDDLPPEVRPPAPAPKTVMPPPMAATSLSVREQVELARLEAKQALDAVKTYIDLEMWVLALNKADEIIARFPFSPEADKLRKNIDHIRKKVEETTQPREGGAQARFPYPKPGPVARVVEAPIRVPSAPTSPTVPLPSPRAAAGAGPIIHETGGTYGPGRPPWLSPRHSEMAPPGAPSPTHPSDSSVLAQPQPRPMIGPNAVAGIKDHQSHQRLVVGESFTLVAGIATDKLDSLTASPVDLGDDPLVDLEIVVHAPDMTIEPDRIQHLKHRREAAQTLIEFVLTPKRAGMHGIDVEFYYLRNWLCQIRLEEIVVDECLAGASH